MECALRDEFMQFAGTVPAFFQRLIRKFLENLFNFSAFGTFVLINRHLSESPRIHLSEWSWSQ
jgi:hypothetical protein